MQTADFEIVAPLYPVDLGNPLRGIEVFLNDKIDKYYPEVKGVLMSFSNVRFCRNQYPTYNELPYIPVNIVMTATVFAPRRGALLTVTVKDIKTDILLCLAAERYNVTVRREAATNPDLLNYPYQENQRIDVLVKHIFTDHGVLQIKADPLALVKERRLSSSDRASEGDSVKGKVKTKK